MGTRNGVQLLGEAHLFGYSQLFAGLGNGGTLREENFSFPEHIDALFGGKMFPGHKALLSENQNLLYTYYKFWIRFRGAGQRLDTIDGLYYKSNLYIRSRIL
jgi:hypothetical protein